MDWDETDEDWDRIPLPRADQRPLIRPEAWRKAEAACAGPLARAAQAMGQVDGVMQMIEGADLVAAIRRRLALNEVGMMLWAQGCPIAPDDLGRDQMDAGADLDLDGLRLGRWALRRLEGQGKLDDLRGFLGLHAVARTGFAGVDGPRLTGAEFDAAATEFAGFMAPISDLHPITRAASGRALWRLCDLSPEGNLVESAVWAARHMAASSSALVFVPLGSAGRRVWPLGGSPADQLARWCEAVAAGSAEARHLVLRLLDWQDRAGRALSRVKGDNAGRVIIALAAAPQALAMDLAERTGCSRDTVERMLTRLQAAGLVRDVTGGLRYRLWTAML
ncbi:MarR family transcriptional regulator [uncultured Paracoccus sp.]|uniref:MarR family transcriptional regulator n=1 Tax=uncultured Paracoccus sp. TaxID=189685 RepID=UPI0026031358|nr:MarR family transcriptional regulator [uncultured Paracoccus sp.]